VYNTAEKAHMLSSDLLQELHQVFDRCQRRYPTIGISLEPFCARMEEILRAGHEDHVREIQGMGVRGCPDCLTFLRQLRHEDLFLALACSRGDRVAWECFTEEYLPLLQRFAAVACHDCDAGQDLAQEMISDLLGQANADTEAKDAPGGKLRSYNGRGTLAGWLRASVSHAAIDRFRRGKKQVSLEEITDGRDLPETNDRPCAGNVETELDARWGPVLIRSLEREIARLEARDRLLLSLYHVHEASLKSIGARYGVHEATASRWLEGIRQKVRKRVESDLRKAHGLTSREVRSLWHSLSEKGDPSLERVLLPLSEGIPAQKKMQGGNIESSSIGVSHE
jgi:RNA polymerase sigma-70 factor